MAEAPRRMTTRSTSKVSPFMSYPTALQESRNSEVPAHTKKSPSITKQGSSMTTGRKKAANNAARKGTQHDVSSKNRNTAKASTAKGVPKSATSAKETTNNKAVKTEATKYRPAASRKRGAETVHDEALPEKRLKRYREKPPQSFKLIEERALTQRFCVLERRRTGTTSNPEETVEIAGTTGNIYTVRIKRLPSCDCPHALKGNQCKHIVYVMKRTLRASDQLACQLALLSSEVQEILAHAPPIPTDIGQADAQNASGSADPRRKPVTDDCPICCDTFEPAREKIVWCKASCGNNVHQDCFQTWAKMKKAQGAKVTCPFCRTTWQDDELVQLVDKSTAAVGPDGYRNVGETLGLTGITDFSTYHGYRRRW